MDNVDAIRKDVLEIVQTYGKVTRPISTDHDLYIDLGIESVNAISILLALESRFRVNIEDARFARTRTVDGLIDLMVAGSAGRDSRVA